MNQVLCDVAVRTICVASDAPVSRSCKTYPVTQTKQNNWTGEASHFDRRASISTAPGVRMMASRGICDRKIWCLNRMAFCTLKHHCREL